MADLGVSQGLLSRWEAGRHEPSAMARTRTEAAGAARKRRGIDLTLRRLIETAPFPVHLVCDDTHALLSAVTGETGPVADLRGVLRRLALAIRDGRNHRERVSTAGTRLV